MTKGLTLPPTRPLVSTFLKDRLGGSAVVRSYYDRDERNAVAVVEASGTPAKSLSCYSTASLHAQRNLLEGEDIRVEFLIVAANELEDAPNVISTAAFNVIKDGWLAAPGVVYPDLVREYFPTTTTPHVMWSEPFDFGGMSSVDLTGIDTQIHWLQAVPISDAEWGFLRERGFDALTERLAEAAADHWDFYRNSVFP